MTKYMSNDDWNMVDVFREFGEYCSIKELSYAVEMVVDSTDIKGKNTYKKKMNLVRSILRDLGYKDIPFRSGYYKKENISNEKV